MLKLAHTVTDSIGEENVQSAHLAEALHGNYGDAQITDAIEQAVQRRLVELSTDDRLVVSAGFNLQPLKPTQPAFIENSLETDLILSGSIRSFHRVFTF
jgi:hypothetical protein